MDDGGLIISEATSKELATAWLKAALKPMPYFMAHREVWEFGAILRTKGGSSHKVMVLRDDGESWSAMLLTGTTETALGTVLHNLFRPNWEPDTP